MTRLVSMLLAFCSFSTALGWSLAYDQHVVEGFSSRWVQLGWVLGPWQPFDRMMVFMKGTRDEFVMEVRQAPSPASGAPLSPLINRWSFGLVQWSCAGGQNAYFELVEVHTLTVPFWFPTTLFGAFPLALVGIRLLRYRRRVLMRWCLRCGYDLTGNESGVCPECAWPVSWQMSRSTGARPRGLAPSPLEGCDALSVDRMVVP